MSSSKSNDLFSLVKSMSKAEKRAFRIFAKRGSEQQHLFIQLFDLIDFQKELDETAIKKKLKISTSVQFMNLKRHLYAQILSSLRMLNVGKKPNIKIREAIDLAYVLYDKGLYMQALNMLSQAEKLCEKFGTDLSLLTILEFKKNIHSRHITRISDDQFTELLEKTSYLTGSINDRIRLTNLKLRLHKIYIVEGHVKNRRRFQEINQYFEKEISSIEYEILNTMEKVYFCQSHVWFNYIVDNYQQCFHYAKRWINLFQSQSELIKRDYNLYLRGFHYVLTSAFNLNYRKEHAEILQQFESFRNDHYKKFNKNNKIFSFLYVHTARLNQSILDADFESGIAAITGTLKRIDQFQLHLDPHKIMVLYYKIAWIYIRGKNAKKALLFLEQIIALKHKSLREDIQSYARIMHMIALYELEEYNMILSVIRKYKYYFEQVKETNELQKICIKYFQQLSSSAIFSRRELIQEFYEKLQIIRRDPYEKRAFLYLHIIEWLEEKI